MAKTLALLLLLFSLSACSTTVSKQEVSAATFQPLPTNYQQLIRAQMSGQLKDPYSAVYRFGQPHRGYWQEGIIYGGKKHYGYIVPVAVNARNSFGGYTGEEMFYFGYEHGQIVGVTTLWNGPPKMAGFID